jgi:hypothetical protein
VSDEIQDLDEMLGFLSEEDRRDPEEHPSPETLTAYQANELSPAEDERIQSHLAICKHCAELLLDLDEFLKAPAAVAEPVADFEAAADWRRLREALKRDVGEKPPARPDRRRFLASGWGGYSAAALLVISIGLGAWNVELFRELRKPQPIRTVLTLSAQGSTRGGERPGPNESVTLPALIILTLPTYEPAPSYQVTIFRQEPGKVQWSLDVLQEHGDLSFILPARSLGPGTYILHVAGHGSEQPRWEYRLSVAPPTGRVFVPGTR